MQQKILNLPHKPLEFFGDVSMKMKHCLKMFSAPLISLILKQIMQATVQRLQTATTFWKYFFLVLYIETMNDNGAVVLYKITIYFVLILKSMYLLDDAVGGPFSWWINTL